MSDTKNFNIQHIQADDTVVIEGVKYSCDLFRNRTSPFTEAELAAAQAKVPKKAPDE